MKPLHRCAWPGNDSLMITYHDTEWGVPLHDDPKHYEFLVLDAMQAGLSWRTVLHKRENFHRAFAGFDPGKVARFGARDVNRLMRDAGIIRNRLKIESAIANARQFLRIQETFVSFDAFIWQFVNGRPIVNRWRDLKQVPARTKESDAMSRELKQRGFRFVGSTICYAYMQAAGMVNDHVSSCFRHRQVQP
jgi:DNA-3-methyladenine glycosylase I